MSRLHLAFVDPGLRKAPFFLELRKTLPTEVRCLYYSRRTIVRGLVRSAGAPLFPNLWRQAPRLPLADEELRTAMGEKEWATRGPKLLPRARARALAADLSDFFDTQRVDAVLVWNGSNLLVSLAVYLARRRGLRVVFAEHGYLPGTLQLDDRGVNFDASITQLALAGTARLPADPALEVALDHEIACYRSGKPARLNEAPTPPPRPIDLRSLVQRKIDLWAKTWFRRNFHGVGVDDPVLPERFVFLPFQVRKDSQLIAHSPLVGNDMARLLELLHGALALVDPQMRIVVKFHPRENPKVLARYVALMRQYPDVLFIRRHRLTELLEQAAAVVTVNSTVGFEAFLYDKPVITLGRNFYTAPHLVEQVKRIEDLPEVLRRALTRPVDHEQRRAFLRYVYTRFLSFGHYNNYSASSLGAVAKKIVALLGLPDLRSAVAREDRSGVPPGLATTAREETCASVGDASSRTAGVAVPVAR